jgi:hypothetical protein
MNTRATTETIRAGRIIGELESELVGSCKDWINAGCQKCDIECPIDIAIRLIRSAREEFYKKAQ